MKYSNRSSQWYSTAYRVDREIPADALNITTSPANRPVQPLDATPWPEALAFMPPVTPRPDAIPFTIEVSHA